jgi:hypothetical protein
MQAGVRPRPCFGAADSSDAGRAIDGDIVAMRGFGTRGLQRLVAAELERLANLMRHASPDDVPKLRAVLRERLQTYVDQVMALADDESTARDHHRQLEHLHPDVQPPSR